MRPIELSANQPRQFYRGGDAIAHLIGDAPVDGHRPEDWVASTTSLFAHPDLGLSTLTDGRTLAALISADPVDWLGARHVDAFGADPALLVKLLDAAERLPVHVHPSRSFASSHLGCQHGKTEAWVVVGAGRDAEVFVGFRDDVEPSELNRWVTTQDSAAMLARMHRLAVVAGDTVLVPAGTPHAIGADVFCIELQEPTDFSINLEWQGFDLPEPPAATLGLELDVALACVRHRALSSTEVGALRSGRGDRLFPAQADPFFRAERIRPDPSAHREASYAVIVILDGDGTLHTAGGETVELRRGTRVVVPHSAGSTVLTGSLLAIRCLPPDPDDAFRGGA